MRLAIVGIRGLPNTYGGFETLAENLVEHLSAEFQFTVYCSSKDMDSRLSSYKGAALKYIPVTSHGGLGMVYDSLALADAVRNHDKVLFLGFGAGFIMPLLKQYRSRIILNFGGLDWKRNKWSPFARKVIRTAERFLVRNSGTVIADNEGIRQYIKETYGIETPLIAYGGDQAAPQAISAGAVAKYPFLSGSYAFSVARIQPDNNIDMILDAFSAQDELPLVMVGNWDNSAYGKQTREKYSNRRNLILLDAIYDRTELDLLRSNCTLYVHGHSAGGTNPALAEAMYLGLPVFAYASGYNEYTTEEHALFFTDAAELTRLVTNYRSVDLKGIGDKLKAVAERLYRWKHVAAEYRTIFMNDAN